jgi:hypothetical protein
VAPLLDVPLMLQTSPLPCSHPQQFFTEFHETLPSPISPPKLISSAQYQPNFDCLLLNTQMGWVLPQHNTQIQKEQANVIIYFFITSSGAFPREDAPRPNTPLFDILQQPIHSHHQKSFPSNLYL